MKDKNNDSKKINLDKIFIDEYKHTVGFDTIPDYRRNLTSLQVEIVLAAQEGSFCVMLQW